MQIPIHHLRRWVRLHPEPLAPPVEDVRDDLAAIVEAAPRAGGDRCVWQSPPLGHEAAGELGRLADDEVGAPLVDVALQVGKHRLDGATREDDAVRPAPSIRIGPRRRIGEQLLEGACAAGEVLVAGIGHEVGERRRRADRDDVAGVGEALGDRQERVEMAGRGKARQEGPHLGQEPPRAFEVRMRTELLEDRRGPSEIGHGLPRLRLPEEDPGDVEDPVLPIERVRVPPSCRGTTRLAARSSRRRRHSIARAGRPPHRRAPGRRPSGRDRLGEPSQGRAPGHTSRRCPGRRGRRRMTDRAPRSPTTCRSPRTGTRR